MIGFVTGLPRCRTRWFADYLDGYDGVTAYHEALCGLNTKRAFYHKMERPGHVINSDSGLYITDFQQRWPDAPTVIIERDMADVYASLCELFGRSGLPEPNMTFLAMQKIKIDQLKGLRVAFEDINERLEEITEYLGITYDPDYAVRMAYENRQMPVLKTNINSYQIWNAYS